MLNIPCAKEIPEHSLKSRGFMPYCIQCEIGARCVVNQRPPCWIYCVYMPCPEVPVLDVWALFLLFILDLNYNTLNK